MGSHRLMGGPGGNVRCVVLRSCLKYNGSQYLNKYVNRPILHNTNLFHTNHSQPRYRFQFNIVKPFNGIELN